MNTSLDFGIGVSDFHGFGPGLDKDDNDHFRRRGVASCLEDKSVVGTGDDLFLNRNQASEDLISVRFPEGSGESYHFIKLGVFSQFSNFGIGLEDIRAEKLNKINSVLVVSR